MNTPLLPPTTNPSSPMKSNQASTMTPASLWIRRSLKLAFGIVATVLIVRIVVAFWLRSYMGDSMDELSKATGMDAAIASWLKGVAITVAAFSLAPWFLRWFAGLTLPGFDTVKTMRLSLIALTISGIAVCMPPAIRAIRGLDVHDLPKLMEKVDPHMNRWFSPDNKPLIAVSFERDGSWQFWNRSGTTPQSAIPATWVTPSVREAWEKVQQAEHDTQARDKRAAEDKARKEAELRELERAKKQAARDEESRREQARRAESSRKERIELEAHTRQLAAEADAERIKQQEIRARYDEEMRRQKSELERTKARVETEHRQVTKAPHALPWQSRTVRPGQFLYVWNFPSDMLEVSLPVESVIEVPGYQALVYRAGVARISLRNTGKFRVTSRANRPFEIQYRPGSR